MKTLHGIVVPFSTPFTASEDVDIGQARALADFLIEAGVHGLIILGDTGEFYTLAQDERLRYVEAMATHLTGRVPVVVQPSAISTREAVAYARHAEQCGADALMMLPPYYRSSPAAEVYAHYEAVAKAVTIPIIAYCLPGVSTEAMTPALLARLAQLETIRYVKDSTGILSRIREIRAACNDALGVFVGGDSIAYDGLAAGAVGSIWGAANFMPRECVRLYELVCQKGDLTGARELWDRMFPICSFLDRHGYAAAVKAGLSLIGMDMGHPRRPALPMTAEERAELAPLLRNLGLKVKG